MRGAIQDLGDQRVIEKVTYYADQLHIPPYLHIDYVCQACIDNVDLAPNYKKSRKGSQLTQEQCIERWVASFLNGYNSRISCRVSKMPGTVPDSAINTIIHAGLPNLPFERVDQVVFAHRLAMSAENILGLLLEEFLFNQLAPIGWAMAWGETIERVDFCNKDGFLLQIKNRSNSENSSSSRVRQGTEIQKWFRVNAATGTTEWEKLGRIICTHVEHLDENAFVEFIEETLANNHMALAIEPNNPWRNIRS